MGPDFGRSHMQKQYNSGVGSTGEKTRLPGFESQVYSLLAG